MSSKYWIELTDQQIVWQYRRDVPNDMVVKELNRLIQRLGGSPFAFLTDLRQIRYILPEDCETIRLAYDHVNRYSPLDAVYLVDFRNYNRMRLLIQLNRFPNSEMVFKYEADAVDYLNGIILKQRKHAVPESALAESLPGAHIITKR